MTLNIRIAQWYDCDAVSRLSRESWQHDLSQNPDLSPVDNGIAVFDHTLRVAGWLRNPKAAVVLATDDVEPLGYLAMGLDHTCPYRQEPTVFIDGFYVKPEARIRNIGGLLYRYARKLFHPNVPKFSQAVVLSHNKDVQVMLERFGFVESGKLYEKVN